MTKEQQCRFFKINAVLSTQESKCREHEKLIYISISAYNHYFDYTMARCIPKG
jgi:hypothetical protein